MNDNEIDNSLESVKKDSFQKNIFRRKYKIVLLILLLCILTLFIYKILIWKPVESASQKAYAVKSKAIILQAAAVQLNKEVNVLTNEDFAKIKKFSLDYRSLCDLRCLEKFSNLEELRMAYLQIPIKKRPKWMNILAKFGFYKSVNTSYVDLSPIAKLSNLQNLEIAYSQVNNLGALKNLDKLRSLRLDGTIIPDFKPLSNLNSLKELVLVGSNIIDLKPISRLPNLETLILSNTFISDLEPIKKLKNLKTLEIKNCTNISYKQVEDLKNVLPDLQIWGIPRQN